MIQQALHGEYALRPACSPHDRRGNAIGESDGELDPIGRQHIRSGNRGCRYIRRDDAPGQKRAGIVQEAPAQAQEATGRIDRDLHIPVLIALLGCGNKVFAPVFLPGHGAAEFHGRGRNDRLFRVERRLRPEAAADQWSDDPNRFQVAIEQIGQRGTA